MIEYQEIYQMFVNVASDLYAQMFQWCQNNSEEQHKFNNYFIENLKILDNLVNYFNENFKKLGKMFKCVYPGITGTYTLAPNIERHLRDVARTTPVDVVPIRR